MQHDGRLCCLKYALEAHCHRFHRCGRPLTVDQTTKLVCILTYVRAKLQNVKFQ